MTERKARVQLPAADLDEHGRAWLSYQQAEALFVKASGGKTLHQLRHSALTHDSEDETGTPMPMARSGHTSVRSLSKYARVSAEALAHHQAERDPARPVATAVPDLWLHDLFSQAYTESDLGCQGWPGCLPVPAAQLQW